MTCWAWCITASSTTGLLMVTTVDAPPDNLGERRGGVPVVLTSPAHSTTGRAPCATWRCRRKKLRGPAPVPAAPVVQGHEGSPHARKGDRDERRVRVHRAGHRCR